MKFASYCAQVFVRQAPNSWLIDLNRKPLVALLIFMAANAACSSSLWWIPEGPSVRSITSFVGFVSCLFAALLFSRCGAGVKIELRLFVGIFALITSAFSMNSVFAFTDEVQRTRFQATYSTLWKSAPVVLCWPLLQTCMLLIWASAIDVATLWANYVKHGDSIACDSLATSLIFLIFWLALAVINSVRLRKFYDVQQALIAEKALMESIVSLMCDAMLILSEGGRVLRTDQHCRMILGQSLEGLYLVDALAEEDVERLQDCLLRKDGQSQPIFLPSTLLTSGGRRIPAELLIVGDRELQQNSMEDAAFLVGVKIKCAEDTTAQEELAPEKEVATNPPLLLRGSSGSLSQEEALPHELQSAPDTTSTDHIFTDMDVSRWVETHDGDEPHGVSRTLSQVASIGFRERWLLDFKDLHLSSDQPLGAGTFGVVMPGWLHGSPIAVKTTKNATDNASAKHLLTIANEIRILRHVRHPNVVLFYGACVDSGSHELMLILERVKGLNLGHFVLGEGANANIATRFQLLLDVACALRFLHAQQPCVVHGDLKASNILVEAAIPRAKLTDFGLSRLLTKHPRPLGGTLDTMAPEILTRCAKRPLPSADVFSFGCITYLTVTGKKAFDGLRRKVIVDMARKGIMPTLIWQEGKPLHAEGSEICKQLLNPVPEQRPPMVCVHKRISRWNLPDDDAELELTRMPSDEDNLGCSIRDLLAANQQLQPQQQQQAPAVGRTASGRPHDPADSLSPTTHTSRTTVTGEGGLGLLLPSMLPTQDFVKKVTLVGTTMQWNFTVPPGCCCKYHAAMLELRRVGDGLMRRACCNTFSPHQDFQCTSCGFLDVEVNDCCPICNTEQEQVKRPRDAERQRKKEKHGEAYVCSL